MAFPSCLLQLGWAADASSAADRRFAMSHPQPTRPVPSFVARLAELLAATDRFVGWWGEHRAWPANESPRIGRCR